MQCCEHGELEPLGVDHTQTIWVCSACGRRYRTYERDGRREELAPADDDDLDDLSR